MYVCLEQKARAKGVNYVRVLVKGLGPGRLVSSLLKPYFTPIKIYSKKLQQKKWISIISFTVILVTVTVAIDCNKTFL